MKKNIVFVLVFLSFLIFNSAGAVIYKYVDDEGTARYTDDPATVPADKQDQVTEIEEAESTASVPKRSHYVSTYPLLNNPDNEILKEQREREEKKEQLETEYAALLKEKEAMDNDKSFQKRRNKRKYQNRPYIKELVAREAEINQRLKELEGLLRAY